MNNMDVLTAIGNIDDDLIHAAGKKRQEVTAPEYVSPAAGKQERNVRWEAAGTEEKPAEKKKKRAWLPAVIGLAAAIAVIAVVVKLVPRLGSPSAEAPQEGEAAGEYEVEAYLLGGTGLLDLKEVEWSETMYGEDKETVFQKYQLTSDDHVGAAEEQTYFALSKMRTIGGLSFLYRLAFNLPSEYTGQDLVYIGETGSIEDEEVMAAIKSIYAEALEKYGEPDNDPDVVMTRLADWIKNDRGRVYSTYDVWHLTEKTTLTIKVETLWGTDSRAVISVIYRENTKIESE